MVIGAFGPVTVPRGRLFVMGDHRSVSADSTQHLRDRYGGTIAVSDVVGKVSLIVWPPSRFGTVGDHEVRSPFEGLLIGMLAVEGERVTTSQPIAWLRTA